MYIDLRSRKIKNIEWKTKRSTDKKISLNNKLIGDVIEKLFQPDMLLQSCEINCFTSLYISDGTKDNTKMYRADPYFYNKPWMDWCNSS